MSATARPFGMNPIRHINGKFCPPPMAMLNGIASAYGSDIFFRSPVTLNTNGTVTATAVNTDFYGVFAGWQGVASATALMAPAMQWAAGTTYSSTPPGYMYAYVWTDPGIIYEIQANGSLAQTSVGDQADFINPGLGNTTQSSTAAISTTLAGAGAQAQLRIIGLGSGIDNAWGDAFTIVEVQIARQQFVSNKVAV